MTQLPKVSFSQFGHKYFWRSFILILWGYRIETRVRLLVQKCRRKNSMQLGAMWGGLAS